MEDGNKFLYSDETYKLIGLCMKVHGELGEMLVMFLAARSQRRSQRNDDLAAIAGTWVDDPAMDKAFAEMDLVDDGLWK